MSLPRVLYDVAYKNRSKAAKWTMLYRFTDSKASANRMALRVSGIHCRAKVVKFIRVADKEPGE